MNRRSRPLLLLVVAIACGALLFASQAPRPTSAEGEAAPSAGDLEATGNLKWYRGNLHTHSLWSDGDDYLEMIALWYRDRGYDFLGFTDHNTLARSEKWIDVEKTKGKRTAYDKLKARFPEGWVEERTRDGRLEVRLKTFEEVFKEIAQPGKFLLIQGEEISDRFGNLPVHMNATNLDETIPPMHGGSVYETMQNNVDALIAQRERTKRAMMIHLNHPNFGWGVTAEDLMRVRGENFFEVYNGHPGVNNSGDEQRASTERLWDIILTRRIAELELPLMYGLGTDDGHNYHKIPSRASEPGRGWVMVLADELTPEKLIAALEAGRFYASSGVTLDRVAHTSKTIEVAVRPEEGVTYTIEFLGTRQGFDPKHEPVLDKEGKPVVTTHNYSKDIGAVLQSTEGTKAEYAFSGDELYVRARVTSSKKHPNPSEPGEFERAWIQPVYGPGAR